MFVKVIGVVVYLFAVTMMGTRQVSGTVLSQDEKNTLLYLHNEARRNLDVSCYNDTVLPGATQMRELIWDDALEFIAQQTADKCIYEHTDPDTDEYALLELVYGKPGQNLAGGTNVTSAFINWFDMEAINFDANEKICYSKCGHFLTILQDGIDKIGCARPDEEVCSTQYLFCDFLPSVETDYESPYVEGNESCVDMISSYWVDGWLCRECKDEDPELCAMLKAENGGNCTDDIMENCNYTCGNCDGGTQYLPGTCDDADDVDCDSYETLGYCEPESDYYWMAIRDCRDTCDFTCECMNTDNNCNRYDGEYCEVDNSYHMFMVLTCPDTCGFCDIELDFPLSDIDSTTELFISKDNGGLRCIIPQSSTMMLILTITIIIINII